MSYRQFRIGMNANSPDILTNFMTNVRTRRSRYTMSTQTRYAVTPHSTSVLGKEENGKVNSVPLDVVNSMVQSLLPSDGQIGRAFKMKKGDT